MALIGNYSINNKSGGRFIGGGPSGNRSNYNNTAAHLQSHWVFEPHVAVPQGYGVGAAWHIPRVGGGINLTMDTSATLAQTVVGGLSATLAMNVTGVITSFDAGLIANLILSMTAAGTTSMDVSAVANITLSMNATGTTSITAGAIANIILDMVVSGTLDIDNFATANISLAMDNSSGGLSASTIAAAVWNEIIESGYSSSDILKVLAAFAAGKTSITALGGGDATVVFRDLGDTKDRIEAGMEGSERTTVTLDTV